MEVTAYGGGEEEEMVAPVRWEGYFVYVLICVYMCVYARVCLCVCV